MKKHRRLFAAILISAVLIMIVSAAVYAKYISGGSGLSSELVPAELNRLNVSFTEGTDPDSGMYVLSGVRISAEEKNYPIYVRTALSVVWQNADGETAGQQPLEGRDYSFGINEDNWYRSTSDGRYYCKSIIKSGDEIPLLIDGRSPLRQLRAAPFQGYSLRLMISAQYIQAVGTTDDTGTAAAATAWGTVPQTDP